MRSIMDIEIDARKLREHILVLKASFRTVAEWKTEQSFRADCDPRCKRVHFIVRIPAVQNALFDPTVLNPGTVDAKKHPRERLLFCIVHMGESIDAACRIENVLLCNSVDHSGCPCRCRDLPRLQHME